MPSSSIRKFDNPDDYAAGIRVTRAELTVTARGKFAGELARIDFHRLWTQRFAETLPRVANAASVPGRAVVTFVTCDDSRLTSGGLELGPAELIRHPDGHVYYHRIPGPTGFASMSLSVADMVALGETVVGRDLSPPTNAVLVRPPTGTMARLRAIHAEAGRLAREAPDILTDPDAAHGLEQALIASLADCLSLGGTDEDSSAARRHDAIMRRFRRVLEESPAQAIFGPDLCARIGVSQRTLYRCCVEHLGVPPKQFLMRRRMHQVHRALREADPTQMTVTSIATRFGFWELGRFAAAYARFFGEPPSRTLRRAAERGLA